MAALEHQTTHQRATIASMRAALKAALAVIERNRNISELLTQSWYRHSKAALGTRPDDDDPGSPPPLGADALCVLTLAPHVPVRVLYTNHRNVTAERNIIPHHVWWGTTEWHREQWMVEAWDMDKKVWRSFALERMGPP